MNQKIKRLMSVGIVIGLLSCSFLLIAPAPAQAVTSTWWTMYPSAKNSTWMRALPFPQVSGPCYEAEGRSDDHTRDIYYAGDSSQYVETGDFTNATWSADDPLIPYDVGTPAPDNATILIVLVTAYFFSQSPDSYLLFSIDNRNTWYYSDPIPAAYGPISWNVTDLIAWTPQLLNSSQLWAKVIMGPVASTHYYLDYVGFSYMWSVPYAGGYVPPGESGETNGGMITPTWTSNMFMTALAGVGFIGMIAFPGLAIYAFKSKDDKLDAFIGFIVGESLFIAMLWFALSYFTGNI